jgi:hypothetical protein
MTKEELWDDEVQAEAERLRTSANIQLQRASEMAAWFKKMMAERGLQTYGELMMRLNAPARESEEPSLTWTFVITADDVASSDPANVDTFNDVGGPHLTIGARERMMREYALFSGRSIDYVEQQIASLREVEDRCVGCGVLLYNEQCDECDECGTLRRRMS